MTINSSIIILYKLFFLVFLTKPSTEVTTGTRTDARTDTPILFKPTYSYSRGIMVGMSAGLCVLLLVILTAIIVYWRKRLLQLFLSYMN